MLQLAELPPVEAVITAFPTAFAVTTPFESTVATELFELVQVTGDELVAVIAS